MERIQQRRRQQLNRLILIAIWMLLIFAFSAQPAAESSKISDGISYRIIVQINRMTHSQWTDAGIEEYAEAIHYPIRKAAHMTEYAILALLVWNYLNTKAVMTKITGNKRKRIQALLTEALAALLIIGAAAGMTAKRKISGETKGINYAERDEKESD